MHEEVILLPLRDYRIICQLRQAKLIVLVVAIGHRSKVYED